MARLPLVDASLETSSVAALSFSDYPDSCGQLNPPERIEVLPDTRLCSATPTPGPVDPDPGP